MTEKLLSAFTAFAAHNGNDYYESIVVVITDGGFDYGIKYYNI